MTAYEVSRSTTIGADPARVHALIDDFHAWSQWSPWEGLDPDLGRTYGGAVSGVGAHYAWKGNRRAGQGSMAITASSPGRVDVDLEFLKPFKSESKVVFSITPVTSGAGAASHVTWKMNGEQHGVAALVGKVVSMDRLIGRDFERGLARLKGVAEG